MKITIARSLETLIAGKKGTMILTCTVKVQKMRGLAQKTNGILCWIFISVFHWAGIDGIYRGTGPSKYINNLPVCCIQCSCGT